MIQGIDVSRWQGDIDFNLVKKYGIDFVIVKAGGSDSGFYEDKNFRKNVDAAHQAGLNVGAYYFVGPGCKSTAAGLADAMRFEDLLKGRKFEYPVYIDFEAPGRDNKQGNTDACIAFCEYMESIKYYVGIYASDISGFKDRLYLDQLRSYDKWVARYGSTPKYVNSYGIWQKTSSGVVPGINGRVDLDESKNDYPSIMIKHHLNGF